MPRLQLSRRRIAGGDRPLLAERGPELGERLGCRFRPVVFVLRKDCGAFAARHLDGRDLGIELARSKSELSWGLTDIQ